MLIAFEYEVPDKCPSDCIFKDDIRKHGQNSMCGRCPVLCCTGKDPLVHPAGYRADWAKEWIEFFNTGRPPVLIL